MYLITNLFKTIVFTFVIAYVADDK